jgi:hypothetical protein
MRGSKPLVLVKLLVIHLNVLAFVIFVLRCFAKVYQIELSEASKLHLLRKVNIETCHDIVDFDISVQVSKVVQWFDSFKKGKTTLECVSGCHT